VSQCKQAVRRFDEIISLKAAKLDLDRVIDQMREWVHIFEFKVCEVIYILGNNYV